VSSIDQAARSKRKGRPKQPATTFHLPYDLWDHQSLPILRPKDANGLPVSGAAGIILFKFHVDEAVQAQHSEWAKGLYDNPPLPEEDARLSSLETVMNASVYQHLQPMAKVARDAAIARPLSPEEVTEILSRPAVRNVNTMEDPDSPEGITDPAFMSRSLESFVALASQPANSSNDPFVLAHASPIAPLANIDGSLIGPSPGSSIRARKQSKRLASELPGGAATPVPKKRRATEEDGDGEEVEVEVEGDLKGDGSFLDSL